MKLCFFGVSHLSLVYAAAFSRFATQTIVYDSASASITDLQNGKLEIDEPELTSLLFGENSCISFSCERQNLKDADAIFVAKDVMTNEENEADFSEVLHYLDQVKEFGLQHKPIFIMSQMQPGMCRRISKDFPNLYYFVETLVFGEAVKRACVPERLIVGKSTETQVLSMPILNLLSKFECPIIETNYETAEISKISINLFLASDVVLTSQLSEICRRLGADWTAVADCLKTDRRIGPYAYLKPGLGIAGGNVERDMAAFAKMSTLAAPAENSLATTWFGISRKAALWPFEMLQSSIKLSHESNIAFLGLAYKRNTHSLKNAPSLLVAQMLDCEIKAHDSFVVSSNLPNKLKLCSTIEETVQGADAVVIFNDNDEYKQLNSSSFQKMRGNTIIDPFGVMDPQDLSVVFNYFRL